MLNLIIPYDFDYEKANLRDKIQYHLHKKGWKHADLSAATGIDKSSMSILLNGGRQFNIDHIDKIECALGVERGTLYQSFLGECYDTKMKLRVSKCEKFLLKAATIVDVNLLKDVVNSLLEQSSKNVLVIFNVAEELFALNNFNESVPLYKTVVSSIKNRLDTKLSISYFKLFMCARQALVKENGNIKECKDALLLLLDHIELLPVEQKLKAYVEVAVFYHLMEDSANTLKYAERLLEVVTTLSDNIEMNSLDQQMLSDYYHEALLYKGFALKAMGKYLESLAVIENYAGYNEKYAKYALGNKHLVNILMGKFDSIDKYLEGSINEKKLITLLPVVVESCITHNNIPLLESYIALNKQILKKMKEDNSLIGKKHRMKTLYYLAVYHFNSGDYSNGIEKVLEALELANFFQNQTKVKECLKLFAQYSNKASSFELSKFNQIISNA